MKIFHILSGKANPNSLNGVNKVVHALATEQLRQGHDVTVIGIADNDCMRHQPEYSYHLYQKCTIPFCVPAQVKKLLTEQSDKETIFHFHSVFIPWFLPLMRFLKAHGRHHIIYTPHGAIMEASMKGWKKRLYLSLVESRIMRSAESVHLIGEQTERNRFITPYAGRIVCIPNGFGMENIPPSDQSYGKVIGALCRLTCFQKGLDLLIPAFAEYRRHGGRYFLKIAGDGEDRQKLQEMIQQEGMQDAIMLVGPVYDEQKWDFLKSCVAHISPSRFEGLPTACLESAAVGCIQLTDEATNMGEYVRKYHAGSVIGHPRPSEITAQLLAFDKLNEEEIMQMRLGAQRMISEELNWELITKRVLTELYRVSV